MMDFVSDDGRPAQQPGPEISYSDPAGEAGRDDDPDDLEDTTLAPPDDDPPPAGASAALVIRAPKGVLPPTPGFTVSAVRVRWDPETGEDEEVDGVLFGRRFDRCWDAIKFARDAMNYPEREIAAGTLANMARLRVNRFVVNDGRGQTHWWLPIPGAPRAA